MTNLIRLAFNIAAAVSSAAFALIVFFWVLSHGTADEFSAGRFRVYSILSRNSSLHGIVDFRVAIDSESLLDSGERRPPVTSRPLTPEDGWFHFNTIDTTVRTPVTFHGVTYPTDSSMSIVCFGNTTRWDVVVPDWLAGLAAALLPIFRATACTTLGRRVFRRALTGLIRLRRLAFSGVAAMSVLLCLATAVLWVRSYWVRDFWDHGHGDSRCEIIWVERGKVHVATQVFGLLPPGWRWLPSPVEPSGTAFPQFEFEHDFFAMRIGLIFPHWFVCLVLAMPPFLWTITGHRRKRAPGRCRACGYDLRATPGRCPECGAVPKTPVVGTR